MQERYVMLAVHVVALERLEAVVRFGFGNKKLTGCART